MAWTAKTITKITKVINAVGLNRVITARSDQGGCVFCSVTIQPGQQYRRSGKTQVHELCLKTMAHERDKYLFDKVKRENLEQH